jgi:hypothetical protein
MEFAYFSNQHTLFQIPILNSSTVAPLLVPDKKNKVHGFLSATELYRPSYHHWSANFIADFCG